MHLFAFLLLSSHKAHLDHETCQLTVPLFNFYSATFPRDQPEEQEGQEGVDALFPELLRKREEWGSKNRNVSVSRLFQSL
jgi:hypothetical protein